MRMYVRVRRTKMSERANERTGGRGAGDWQTRGRPPCGCTNRAYEGVFPPSLRNHSSCALFIRRASMCMMQ